MVSNVIESGTLAERFNDANEAAIAGCGLSDVLYTNRYSAAVDAIIAGLPDEERKAAYTLARQLGDYATREERERAYARDIAGGSCGLTGIEPDCCPCGQHP